MLGVGIGLCLGAGMFKEELNGAAGDDAEAGSVRDGDVTVLDGRLALDPGHPGATALGERIGIEGGDGGERPDLAAAVRDDTSAVALGESVDRSEEHTSELQSPCN